MGFDKYAIMFLRYIYVVARIISLFFLFVKFYLFISLWLCWLFVSVRGLSLVAASGGHSSSRCAGLSCCGAQAPDAQAQ